MRNLVRKRQAALQCL